jgi:hypothetical protein
VKPLAPPKKPNPAKTSSPDEDELIEMAISSMNKSGPAKPTPKKTPVKKGEEEFWTEDN